MSATWHWRSTPSPDRTAATRTVCSTQGRTRSPASPRRCWKEPASCCGRATGNSRVAEEVLAATRSAGAVLEALGAARRRGALPLRQSRSGLANPATIELGGAVRRAATSGDRAKLSATLLAGIDAGLSYRGLDLQRALIKRTELFRGIQSIFSERADFILTPATSAPPVHAEHDLTAPLTVDGVEVGDLRAEWTTYLSLFDLSGHPAIAMPAGVAACGAPLGVQLVAPWGRDALLLAAAAAYAELIPGEDKAGRPDAPQEMPALFLERLENRRGSGRRFSGRRRRSGGERRERRHSLEAVGGAPGPQAGRPGLALRRLGLIAATARGRRQGRLGVPRLGLLVGRESTAEAGCRCLLAPGRRLRRAFVRPARRQAPGPPPSPVAAAVAPPVGRCRPPPRRPPLPPLRARRWYNARGETLGWSA